MEAVPYLKPVGTTLLNAAGSVGINLLKFTLALVISGFLFIPGPSLIHSAKNVLGRVAAGRGEEFVDLAGATIRERFTRHYWHRDPAGAIGGHRLAVRRRPGGRSVQLSGSVARNSSIGPSVVLVPLIIWSWFAMDATMAILFTCYMVPVNLIDNIMRPLVAKGLTTPMPVILIGVLGGTLVHGVIGLFVGPIVLSIAWQLLVVWTHDAA